MVGVAGAAADQPAEVMSDNQAVEPQLPDIPQKSLQVELSMGKLDGKGSVQDLVNDKLKENWYLPVPGKLHQ